MIIITKVRREQNQGFEPEWGGCAPLVIMPA